MRTEEAWALSDGYGKASFGQAVGVAHPFQCLTKLRVASRGHGEDDLQFPRAVVGDPSQLCDIVQTSIY